MIAACKQCRRPFFMELSPLQSIETILSELKHGIASPFICIAHPGASVTLEDACSPAEQTGPAAIMIGPEGGFTDDEVQQALTFGAVAVSWPNTILRIETAAIVFATLMMSRIHRSQP
jgi:16S rRNA (uracil1498-N3)-methyltransferase